MEVALSRFMGYPNIVVQTNNFEKMLKTTIILQRKRVSEINLQCKKSVLVKFDTLKFSMVLKFLNINREKSLSGVNAAIKTNLRINGSDFN